MSRCLHEILLERKVRPMGVLSRCLPGLCLCFFSYMAWPAGFDSDYDEKPWTEIEVQLPAFPEKENLVPFKVGSVSDKQFFVDGASISIGSDDVIRYSLVVVSSAGAQSISFEGMRCATGERRVYAFGRQDNTWSKARSNSWVKLQGGSNNHNVALYSDYFCTVAERSIVSQKDAIRVLRYGR